MPYPSSTGEAKKGAADIQELAERVTAYLKERLTLVSEHGSSFTAASGELIKCTAAITITLPAASVNAVVEVLSNGHEVKVGGGAGLIYGDFIEGITPITFVGYQHARFVSDGTNWFMTAGTPTASVSLERGASQSFLSWALISAAGAIEAQSGDFSSVELKETAVYKVNWKTAKTSAKYAVAASALSVANRVTTVRTLETGAFTVVTVNPENSVQNATQFMVVVMALS